MKLHRPAGLVALALLAAASACVGDDPLPASTGGDAGASETGTITPGADGSTADGGDASTCGEQTACGGKCVDTTQSPDHCGACGHTCGGGNCKASSCLPVVVAKDIPGPLGVAVAGGSAFWIRRPGGGSSGAVERCPVTGCMGAPALITADVTFAPGQPGGTIIVSDGNQVAWIAAGNATGNGRDVLACGVAGCQNGFTPKTSKGLTAAPTQIALEGSTLFASQSFGAACQGPLSTLVLAGIGGPSDIPTGIAADAANIYIAGTAQSAAGVDRCTRAGASCNNVTRLFVGAKYIAAGGGVVVATSAQGIKKCAAAGCGGSAAVVSAADTDAAAIAASSAFAAWVNSGADANADGTVRVCALPDCTAPRTVATGQEHPVGVTIADGFVYWVNRGVGGGNGSVWRAAL